MSKVLVDRELLERIASDDEGVASSADFEDLKRVLAQPAEAEGVEVVAAFVYDNDMLLCVEFDPKARMGTADGTALVRQSDHLAALSAVTAERDRLDAECDQLRAEVETLCATALEMRNWISCADVNHRKGEFHDGDECPVLARIDATLAAKEA